MTEEALNRLDAVLQVGLRLAASAPTGRIVLARIHSAIDPDWIPRPWGDAIAGQLEAAASTAREPIERRRVERILADAWGTKPGEELDELEPEPVAVTPGAQVHRGTLEGKPVAIKVLRPGLAASVRQDLALLDGLLSPLAAAFPALDARILMREIRERILDELDLEHEAGTQRRFHRALRNHPFLTVPAPITRLSHENVLVSEWVEGVPLWDAPDPDRAAAQLVVFVLGAGRAGLAHADPKPEDALVSPDGRLAIVDFGATRTVQRGRSELAAKALEALGANDGRAFGRASAALGLGPAEDGPVALDLALHALGELAGEDEVRLDSRAVIAARDRLLERPEQIAQLIRRGSVAPEDLWPLRGMAQLFGAIARVGASGRWRELSLQALRHGWEAPLTTTSPARAASSPR